MRDTIRHSHSVIAYIHILSVYTIYIYTYIHTYIHTYTIYVGLNERYNTSLTFRHRIYTYTLSVYNLRIFDIYTYIYLIYRLQYEIRH